MYTLFVLFASKYRNAACTPRGCSSWCWLPLALMSPATDAWRNRCLLSTRVAVLSTAPFGILRVWARLTEPGRVQGCRQGASQ